jgi:hypothetical protein
MAPCKPAARVCTVPTQCERWHGRRGPHIGVPGTVLDRIDVQRRRRKGRTLDTAAEKSTLAQLALSLRCSAGAAQHISQAHVNAAEEEEPPRHTQKPPHFWAGPDRTTAPGRLIPRFCPRNHVTKRDPFSEIRIGGGMGIDGCFSPTRLAGVRPLASGKPIVSCKTS